MGKMGTLRTDSKHRKIKVTSESRRTELKGKIIYH
jgi:hypothetical protein